MVCSYGQELHSASAAALAFSKPSKLWSQERVTRWVCSPSRLCVAVILEPLWLVGPKYLVRINGPCRSCMRKARQIDGRLVCLIVQWFDAVDLHASVNCRNREEPHKRIGQNVNHSCEDFSSHRTTLTILCVPLYWNGDSAAVITKATAREPAATYAARKLRKVFMNRRMIEWVVQTNRIRQIWGWLACIRWECCHGLRIVKIRCHRLMPRPRGCGIWRGLLPSSIVEVLSTPVL